MALTEPPHAVASSQIPRGTHTTIATASDLINRTTTALPSPRPLRLNHISSGFSSPPDSPSISNEHEVATSYSPNAGFIGAPSSNQDDTDIRDNDLNGDQFMTEDDQENESHLFSASLHNPSDQTLFDFWQLLHASGSPLCLH